MADTIKIEDIEERVDDKDFNLLALSVQFVAGSSVDSRRVFCKRHVRTACLFHIGSTGNQFVDVESGNCDQIGRAHV